MLEFFTDEPKRHCRCGRLLLREAMPSCADWCPAAAQCLGEAVDLREMEKRVARIKGDPRALQCLQSIRELLAAKNYEPGRHPPDSGAVLTPPPQHNLQIAMEKAWEALRRQTPEQFAFLGAAFDGNALTLPVLNDAFALDMATGSVRAHGLVVTPQWQLLALHYLAVSASPPDAPLGTAFADLASGRVYAGVYHARVIRRLCASAGRDAATLRAAALALGAKAAPGGDAAFDLTVFPRVSVRLIWHAPDEEFGPSATLLLPDNIESFFCAEDIVVLSERLVARLSGGSF
jgi:hypothetical protein